MLTGFGGATPTGDRPGAGIGSLRGWVIGGLNVSPPDGGETTAGRSTGGLYGTTGCTGLDEFSRTVGALWKF